ncbi:sensor domain-containing diguanylate cyclase [Robertmurraya korlensis]|uniref:sensor domain-containing diguanylate cyclase n=1 Tax=Robertmurraya korlensis TaxID=519977 RepID=UPI000824B42E|nr:diguanylate cyclase [Robertmurraya korlensis]
MRFFTEKSIETLKSQFFDLIDTESGVFHYQDVIKTMLHTIQKILELEEVTIYISQAWKNQVSIRLSTNANKIQIGQSSLSNEWIGLVKTVDFSPTDIRFKDYQVLIPLCKSEEVLGVLCLKGNQSYINPSNQDWFEQFAIVCTSFVQKAQELYKIVMEEKRYKQLFRVNEKFHSTMDMEAVLGEIIYTLQEEYPSFTYYLMLSHDNDNHSELPIKDLEYDSENIAAMEAYLTGTIQMEDSLTERRSVLYAPLKGKQGVYGVLQVIAPDTLTFPSNEVEFIKLLANTAGSALENAQLYQQSKRLIADLQLINETSHRLNSNLRLTETMSYMTEQIVQSFDAEEVCFVLVSPDLKPISVLAGSTPFFETDDSMVYVYYVVERLKKEKDSIFMGDVEIKLDKDMKRYRSIMAVPMVQSGLIKGLALVMHREPYHFSFETFKLLQSLIHHSTLAFTNSMLREELEKMVVTDHLTKLYSRNYLDTQVHESLVEDQQGTFLLIDIDNFKCVNDKFGHQVGDEILIQVAEIIKSNIRDSDIGARWGGEELAVYLPRIPLDAGISIANRLVDKVRELSKPSITISCGVSYWNVDNPDNFTNLFKRADTALYVAKDTGKDRVVVQEKLPSL